MILLICVLKFVSFDIIIFNNKLKVVFAYGNILIFFFLVFSFNFVWNFSQLCWKQIVVLL